MVRLLLVRHGETVWNAAGRFQGRADMPLNGTGQRQAKALGCVLAAEGVHTLYSSDLQRAWETARIIAEALRCPVQSEPCLREMAFGDWEGLTFAEAQQRDPHLLAAWQTDPEQVAPPRGETLGHVSNRVKTVLHRMVTHCQEQTVVLVAHGGPLRVLLCLALGLSPRSHWQFAVAPGSLSELQVYEQGVVLTRLNDTHHCNEAVYDREGGDGSR
jgi:alpha-ribazole phosphatase